MSTWTSQMDSLIAPAVARSEVTDEVVLGAGRLRDTGALVARMTRMPRVLLCADEAGFQAAGQAVVTSLEAAGFEVEAHVLPVNPLPKASVEEAEPFRVALAADADLFPVSVGSGVINDLTKYAAFRTDRRYVTVATAASMDGYTSAGAPLAENGFKVTIPTRAPIAMLADLDIIATAPAEMNGWGYGDLAGKVPAGGDWILADALGVEPIDTVAWPMVQDHLKGWLAGPDGVRSGERDSLARLFVGLAAVGFAMEAHASSRPASGADHQIAHMWEMEGLTHQDQKVSHGAAVSVGCVAALALFDWLLDQDLSRLNVADILGATPSLQARKEALLNAIDAPKIAQKAGVELEAKFATADVHAARLMVLKDCWPALRNRLQSHLYRHQDMADMLRQAGAPAFARQIGVTPEHLLSTMRAATFIRRRYTIFDLLHDIGQTEAAFAAVMPKLISGKSAMAS
ncbi:Glycerol-1-phosphate dehydrogenase [NAD(P)+] [Roseobacter fucihabitans]|uniref:Glycerol-1-phosphate dehydrogenase [NAD(P)+] n=1 Tax=Roseobacter fucihabitans TaxID=1537242 RepID=A0ABZ2BWS7_9RHOB|nr:sn-glycerol-1-phosphate dehydrogenase [Roseobacter litoralis]MBC6966085.1 Glycerol-1-phosphate dehydrogenase (NAD(P)+) [Roseobacter litoralis]